MSIVPEIMLYKPKQGFVILFITVVLLHRDTQAQGSTSTVFFQQNNVGVGEWQDYVELDLLRENDIENPCSFILFTKEGTAVSPHDFTHTSHQLLFPANVNHIDVSITIIDDLVIEPTENFTVLIGSTITDPDIVIGLPRRVLVTIWDDDDIGGFSPPVPPQQCSPDTCQNGGTCYGYDNDTFVCECTNFWTGNTCEDPSPCFIDGFSICEYGAQCHVTSPDDFWCDCDPWYRGELCEIAPLLEPLIVYILAGCFFLIIVLVCILCCCCCCRCRQKGNGRANSRNADDVEMKPWKGHQHFGLQKANSYVTGPLSETTAVLGGKFEFPREQLMLKEEIGRGAFASVHLAEAVGINGKAGFSKVAVKMLKHGASDTDRRDFMKELDLYKSLERQPNIISLFGCCTENAPMYLILEFAPNGNLHLHLTSIRTGDSDYVELGEKYLSPTGILSYASQIAKGMEYLTSKNCVHRDLATRNVLLGEGMICKLSDFGLARDLENEQQYEMRSKGRVPVRWMAIESLLLNIYTSQSDVWSFGVLLWELVTLGSHPYPGFSSTEVIAQISKGFRLPRPKHCGEDVYAIMQRCWNSDPKERPTFKGLRYDLENMLGNATGYLMMSDFNEESYVYLEPSLESHGGNTDQPVSASTSQPQSADTAQPQSRDPQAGADNPGYENDIELHQVLNDNTDEVQKKLEE